LSPTFAANVGDDDTMVFSGSLSLSSADTGPVAGPKDFDVVITLHVPFLYDPTAGHLLLDVRNVSGGSTTPFDATSSSGDLMSRSGSLSGDVTSPTADFSDTVGLVTQFTMTSATVQVAVDVKPGGFPNSINPKSKGVIPVAILTTDAFDATSVDPLSVQFGPNGATEAHGRGHIEDADGDGDDDLVLHFNTQATGIRCGETAASLTGETFDGQAIEGADAIQTVGCK
jgi:hypothetical protein